MQNLAQRDILSEPELEKWFARTLSEEAWHDSRSLEKEDTWVSDGPETNFYQTLKYLAQQFDLKQNEAGIFIDNENMGDFIQVLAYTKTTPSIRLLSLLGQCQPGLGGDVLRSCDESREQGHPIEAESKVVMARIKLLARMEVYRMVFGPDRRRDVLELLEEAQGSAGGES
jgi:hypothetical protein